VFNLKSEFLRLDKSNRLYGTNKPIIGLTGGVATGKSTVSKKIINLGFPIIEADKLVHQIYDQDISLEFIKISFPTAIENGQINFPALRKIFFENSKAREKIETFIYDRLKNEFIQEAEKLSQNNFLIYDVPLLFEKGLNELVDLSVCVYCDQSVQISRMIKRDSIDKGLAQKMIQNQMDIERKRLLSDWVIENKGSLEDLDLAITNFLNHYFTK